MKLSLKSVFSILHIPTRKRTEDKLFPAPVTQRPRRVANPREEDVEVDRELILEDAGLIREGLWRIARYAQNAAEALDSRIEDETLDGREDAVEVREALERLQATSLEVSEEPDAYQQRYARLGRSHPRRRPGPQRSAYLISIAVSGAAYRLRGNLAKDKRDQTR